ncbi:MAG: hypothetical protein LBR66_02845 [Candidatus Symbiothrix sp.]|jgi:hypothetical protein|nr:hypothetical protein [Candidatus Symbiothrix sp.]
MKVAVVTMALLVTQILGAQVSSDNTEWMHFLEELAEQEDADHEAIGNLFEELSFRAENPYNLHTISKEDLETLPFLSDEQIENLLYYLYKYSPIVDIHELQNVESFDRQTILYLLPFVYIGEQEIETSSRKSAKYSKNSLLLRSNRTVQQRAGYENGKYWGDPYYVSLRYEWNYSDKLLAGFTAEKDAGEQLWQRGRGVDYLTYNIMLKNIEQLESLHIGNYRLSFGQGLTMNTNFSMGKTADVNHTEQKNAGIQRHLSTNESSYFNGLAGAVRWGNFRLYLFYSMRRRDATADDSTIATLQTDGYHRTYNEWMKRAAAETSLLGEHLQWQKDQFTLGLTAVYYDFGGKDYNPAAHPYNYFYLRGKEAWNIGLSYKYQYKKSHFSGETAVDKAGKVATIHHLHFKPATFLSWTLSLRHFDRQYNALYGKTFSESTTVQNETGVYNAIQMQLPYSLELSAFLDYFRFPWLKFEVNTPSDGKDALLQLKYSPRRHWNTALRYRYKNKQKNLLPYEQHRWRWQLNYAFSSAVSSRFQADYNRYLIAGTAGRGWSLTQTLSYSPLAKLQIDGGLAYFNTDAWDTRISIYEKSLPYTFSFPTYYGRGLRYYALLRWKITSQLTVYFKCGSSHYFDVDAIGSGDDLIQGQEKTDIYAHLQYRF